MAYLLTLNITGSGSKAYDEIAVIQVCSPLAENDALPQEGCLQGGRYQ